VTRDGPHVFIGFTQDCKNDSVFTGGATVTGTVTNLHQSRPPAFTFFSGAPFPGCWVALNDLAVGDGQGIYAGPCNEDSTFSIPDVPAGSYELAIFDANLGLIFGRYGFTVSTAEADGNATIVLGGDGNVPVFAWFARHENMVFNDLNENGFRDPGEPPMAEQAINLRFRDGTVYQSFPTDLDGFVPFDEIFPFFNWFVTEVDFARFKATGMTYVVDAGGEVPPDDGWNMPSRGQLNPMPRYCTAADVAAGTAQTIDPGVDGVLYTDDDVETPCVLGQPIINPNTNNNLSRTEPGVVLTYGYQQFLGQTSLFEWGKKAYDRGENGGISGIVYYAITRAEDDPAYAAAEPWEPGIPRIQLALYQDRNRDGVIDDLSDPPDGPTTADVDNYPFDWAPAYSGEPGWTGTPGPEDLDDGTFVGADGISDGNGVFDYGDAIQIGAATPAVCVFAGRTRVGLHARVVGRPVRLVYGPAPVQIRAGAAQRGLLRAPGGGGARLLREDHPPRSSVGFPARGALTIADGGGATC